MRITLKNIILFLFTVVIIVLSLRFISWLPGVIQKDTVREYGSIKVIRSALDIKEFYEPQYFPENIVWPPSRLFAQRKPFLAVYMGYSDAQSGEIVLSVHQSSSDVFLKYEDIGISEIRQRGDHMMDGKHAELVVGVCAHGETCSSVTWREGEERIKVSMKSTPVELLKIAGSIQKH